MTITSNIKSNMRTITLIILLLIPGVSAMNQPKSDPIYLVLTSSLDESISKGVIRGVSQISQKYPQDFPAERYKYPSILFDIKYNGRDGAALLGLHHKNFNITELAKVRQPHSDGSDEMEIITKSDTFLKEISYIDVDEFLKDTSQEKIWELGDKIRHNKVYIIDRNDIKNGQMVLIEVRLYLTTKPPHQPGQEVEIDGKIYKTLW